MTITYTYADPITLTWGLRYELTDTLVEAIKDGLYGSHGYYLDILQKTAPDTVLTVEDELYDALVYFGFVE